METWALNPWAPIEDRAIYTLDQVNMLEPIRLFPSHPWLREITYRWMEHTLIAVVKSRRMICSWLFCWLHTWMASFREGAAVFLISDKEEKSDELIQRCAFMYSHIPDDMMLKSKFKYTYCNLSFPGLNSYIKGVPQGPRQLAQYTATAVLCDEFANWEQARQTFMALKPTIEGGGKITLLSTPEMGFFKDVCFDLIR